MSNARQQYARLCCCYCCGSWY